MEILDEQLINPKTSASKNFFDSNSFFIDEKVGFFKFENVYKVYNDNGDQIGNIKQRIPLGYKLLSLLINKAMLPFKLEILDNNEVPQASLKRGWTFLMSKIEVLDSFGNQIGFIKQKFKLFKPTFQILDANSNLIATITGDWKAWNFQIADAQNNPIGLINKKWAGAMKELFTTADKYNVTIDPSYTDEKSKIVIISTAITIDMVLKEKK